MSAASEGGGDGTKRSFSSIRDAIQHVVRGGGAKRGAESGGDAPASFSVEPQTPTTSCMMTSSGNAGLVPPYETFAGSILSSRRIRESIEGRLREGDVVIGKVRTVDVAGARVRLLAGETKRMDMREAEMEVIVPMSALGRRPQVGEQIRVRIDLARPLRCLMDEAMDTLAGPPATPDYIIESDSYTSWLEGAKGAEEGGAEFRLIVNRHAEEAVGAAARGSASFLEEVRTLHDSYTAKRRRKEAQARALVTQGITSMRAGDRDAAWEMLKEATDVYPACADAYVALGALLVNDGRGGEAEKYFQRALSYEPAHKNAALYYKQVLFGAAVLHEKEERWLDAMGCYERAMAEKIDVDEARTGIERCTKELNERAKRSPSVEILDGSKAAPPSSAPSSVKRPRISAGSRKSSDVIAAQSRKSSANGAAEAPPEPSPVVKVQLQHEERKRLSDLEHLHALLKTEAGGVRK